MIHDAFFFIRFCSSSSPFSMSGADGKDRICFGLGGFITLQPNQLRVVQSGLSEVFQKL
jgi:hypothetical protein